jgi:hypothetical protein
MCIAALSLASAVVAALLRDELSDGRGKLAQTLIRWHALACRVRVRQRLASPSTEQRAAVLLPLRDHRTAGRIIAPFLRELDAHGELTPAAAPDAHGDEPSPS